jgi:hypothetical protein
LSAMHCAQNVRFWPLLQQWRTSLRYA